MQTSPSAPSMGPLALDTSPKGGAERSYTGNDEFSQEYDKQVKNMEHGDKAEAPVEPRPARKETHTDEAAKQQGNSESPEAGDKKVAGGDVQATTDSQQAANPVEQGGNTLPLEAMRKMAAEVEVKLKAGAEAKESDEVVLEQELEAVAEEGGEGAEPSIVPVVAQTPHEVEKVSTAPVAAAVKEAITPKPQPAQSPLQISDEVSDGEETVVDTELPELQAKTRGKGDELVAMTTRQAGQSARGERAFEAMLAAQGRAQPTATPIDTFTPGIAPLAGQGASNALATPLPVAMTLATPMAHANWGQAMAERVVWMSNANIQEAEIQLNPRELGPIGIKVTVQNEQTHVSFVAQHAATRDALEQAIPRLREMLSENGLQLGQSDVSQQGFKGRDGETGEGGGKGQPLAGSELLEGDEAMLAAGTVHGVSQVGPAGVDAFA